jgi:hypothetical protein
LLYADDLVLVAESEKLLLEKIETWKEGMESKGLRVNVSKTKVIEKSVKKIKIGEITVIGMTIITLDEYRVASVVHAGGVPGS